MPNLIVREAKEDDIPALVELGVAAGAGMTTVPKTQEAVEERVAASISAFGGTGKATANQTFFFVLEDDAGPAGMACVFPALGGDRPFYSYRLSHLATASPEHGLEASTDMLYLVNDFHGYTEIGTLFVGERARGGGAGRLLSLSRLLFMGARQERFDEKVMAEIRGWFEPDGRNPFWDHIASKFFDISFDEADRLSAHDFRLISHMMPKFPIYVSLLPDAAKAVIGRAHETSRHALSMLKSEGFEWTRCIDVFDGGPSIEARLKDVRTVRESAHRSLTISENADHIRGNEKFFISTPPGEPFVAVVGHGHREGNTVVVSPEMAARAGLRPNAAVIAAPFKGTAK